MIKFQAKLDQFIGSDELANEIATASEFLPKIQSDPMAGWLDLPINYDKDEFARIKTSAAKINADSEYLVCIGIGGSYLEHKSVIEALGGTSKTKILYTGNSLSPVELNKIITTLGDADFSVNIISKSGTTIEPAIAFRIFRQKLIDKYGEIDAYRRIYATTNKTKGSLYNEAITNNYARFVVPDNIGGRYSVLSAVGLLPIAVAGIDIDELMQGAAIEREALLAENGGGAAAYAATRRCFYEKGYTVEILANFEPSFLYFNEWWEQLAGESEGKDHKGIYPTSVINTTDLHSLGQYIQDGRRIIIETIVKFTTVPSDCVVPAIDADIDGLAYLEGKQLSYINQKAIEATVEAHLSGGVPVLQIEVPDISARSMGALMYFFELAIAISGCMLGVNPFDQPGVEAYKINMFRLLGRPNHTE